MRLVSDERQQEALAKIKRLDGAGASYREIARTLEADGIATARRPVLACVLRTIGPSIAIGCR